MLSLTSLKRNLSLKKEQN